MSDKISRFIRFLYYKLVRINDSPQKVAFGFSMGVFVGIMPFAGPVIALFLAMLFRINRASAIIGSLLTNTWLSVISFLLAARIGAILFGVDFEALRLRITALSKDFNLLTFLKNSVSDVVLPILSGYIVIAVFLGILAYFSAIILISMRRRFTGARKI